MTKTAPHGTFNLLFVVFVLFVIGVIAVIFSLPQDRQEFKELFNVGPTSVKSIPNDRINSVLGDFENDLKSVKQRYLSNSQLRKTNHEESSITAQSNSKQQIKNIEKSVETRNLESNVEKKELIDQSPPVKEKSQLGPNKLGSDTVLLIICSNRPEYLKKTLSYISKYHPLHSVPIFISQDGHSPAVKQVIDDFTTNFQQKATVPARHIYHIKNQNIRYENGYFALAAHFQFALNYVFGDDQPFQRVIILEEDLQIAPDFFEFFAATSDLLDTDESLLAVSAWNDNGLRSLVRDNKQVYRSDFFPGLGWMMTRKLWRTELASKWPKAYWDDWLREPKQRMNRQILRPEVCRTYHFGDHGVSNAQYSEYLHSILLNEQYVAFTQLDMSYLQSHSWDEYYVDKHIKHAPIMSTDEANQLLRGNSQSCDNNVETAKEIRIIYHNNDDFSRVARWSGAMDNIKANVPRTAYKGIVSIWKNCIKVHLTPPDI